MTRVHLTKEQFWFFLNRENCRHFSFFVVYSIGTTENGIRHKWNHDTCSLTSISCFHWFLWEIAKLWCFLKIWPSLFLSDGIIETISMAFSWNIFQAYNRMFIFENNVFKFWNATKSTKCTGGSFSIVIGLAEQFYCYRRVCSIPETQNVNNCSDFCYNFQNTERTRVDKANIWPQNFGKY